MYIGILIATVLLLVNAEELQEDRSFENNTVTMEVSQGRAERYLNDFCPGCGVRGYAQGKISGGSDTRIEFFPWLASLRDSFHNNQHFCAGSLIKPRWVLTAASCYLNRPKKGKPFPPRATFIVFGLTSLGDKSNAIFRRTVRKDHIFHPRYNSATNEYNVALLKMRQMIKPYELPHPVCLGELFDYRVGDVAIATGYGLSQIEPPVRPTNLQKVRARIQNDDLCQVALEGTEKGFHPHSQLCTYERRKSVCAEDEGGPLVVVRGDRYVQVGIMSSWPEECAKRYVPPVYTEVYNVLDWIQTRARQSVCRF